MTASPRRPGLAYLLLGAGGYLGAHRFYLGSYLGGAAQLGLLLFGVSGLGGVVDVHGSRPALAALAVLLAWLLFDIYWVHRRLRQPRNPRASAPGPRRYDPAGVAEANRLQAQFAVAADAQDWARAVAVGEQIVATSRRVFKGPHPNLAMSLCMLGQACYRLQAFDRAKAAIEESLAIGRKVGMSTEDMDIARKALALTLAGIGERNARGAASDRAAALMTLLEDRETRCHEALAQGDLPRAERFGAEAVAASRELCGGPGKAVVRQLAGYAELCRRLQWNDKAEASAHEALAMIGQLGLDDGWRRGPTNTLALLHAAAGRSDEAEALYKKTIAMAIAEAKGGSSDSVLRAFNNLAFLYAESGQEGKAELCYARALVHLDKLDGTAGTTPATPATSTVPAEGDAELHSHMLNNFASLLMGRRDFERARALYERSLAIQQRSCRGISIAAANAHNDLGLIAQDDGDLRQALAHFKRTLLLNQICTPDHFKNIDGAQRNIDSVSMVLAAVAHAARMEPST
jgi:tetratricopeptide (TPR) repeat protein